MKRILTKQDLVDLGNPERVLVPKGTVVTPLAHEHISARRIAVEFSNEVDRPTAPGGGAKSGAGGAGGASVGVPVEEQLVEMVLSRVGQVSQSGGLDHSLISAVVEEVVDACRKSGLSGSANSSSLGAGGLQAAALSPMEHVVHSAHHQEATSTTEGDAQTAAQSGTRVIVAVTGANAPGMAAVFCQTMADAGVDIVDISQTLVSGFYSMLFVVDLAGMVGRGLSLIQFRERIQATAESVGAQAWVMHENVLKAMHRL